MEVSDPCYDAMAEGCTRRLEENTEVCWKSPMLPGAVNQRVHSQAEKSWSKKITESGEMRASPVWTLELSDGVSPVGVDVPFFPSS